MILTKQRDSRFVRLVLVACCLVFATSAAIPPAAAIDPPPGVGRNLRRGPAQEEPNPSGINKTEFLTAVSKLGKSIEDDLQLLRNLTGVPFEPLKQKAISREGAVFVEAFVRLSKPGLLSGSYGYWTFPDGTRQAHASIEFDQSALCITADDLRWILGVPARVTTKYEVFTEGIGPSDIWLFEYRYAQGVFTRYPFLTGRCAHALYNTAIYKSEQTP